MVGPDLTTRIGPLTLPTPVMPASGTFGYGEEYLSIINPRALGAIVTKSLSPNPKEGNPPPRIAEVAGGVVNSIGLENIGVEAFLKEKLPLLRDLKIPIVVSFFGETVDEYLRCAERLGQADGIGALEANLSCPNVKRGGAIFGRDPEMVLRITRGVKEVTEVPLWVKLPPDLFGIGDLSEAAEEGGADAVTLINTLPALVVDLESRRPFLGGGVGGLSGEAIRPVALRLVWETAKRVRIPVIGVGGIRRGRDALEFILVGASAVQVGTAVFSNPLVFEEMVEEIRGFMVKEGLRSIEDIKGRFELGEEA